VDAARYLTGRTRQSGQVSFETASALDLTFDDGDFGVALLEHVAMNVADRARLCSELRRVLKSKQKRCEPLEALALATERTHVSFLGLVLADVVLAFDVVAAPLPARGAQTGRPQIPIRGVSLCDARQL
jgi:hypothetical protein